ncbi:hypothetical protein BGZ73_004688 [Actinomortierella ambigua]|nr:hypothetical protein BGZ73_004688 [Actinomortierella ambigua]
MAKFTSLIVLAAAAIAAIASPIPTDTTVAPTPTAASTPAIPTIIAPEADHPITTAAQAEAHLMAAAAEEKEIRTQGSNDPFATSVTHRGKATWFTHTYGACNVHWNGYKEPVVALNDHQMGVQSWGNPACGRKVRVTNTANGKSVVARIVDKCPGDECLWGSLDLSPAAFSQIGHLDTGILNIEWNYV